MCYFDLLSFLLANTPTCNVPRSRSRVLHRSGVNDRPTVPECQAMCPPHGRPAAPLQTHNDRVYVTTAVGLSSTISPVGFASDGRIGTSVSTRDCRGVVAVVYGALTPVECHWEMRYPWVGRRSPTSRWDLGREGIQGGSSSGPVRAATSRHTKISNHSSAFGCSVPRFGTSTPKHLVTQSSPAQKKEDSSRPQ